jgi:primosomal protein N' (replication factor Y)
MFAKVVLPVPLQSLTYEVPDSLKSTLTVGTPVLVPLRKKLMSGIVNHLSDSTVVEKSKEIIGRSYELPQVSATYLEFLEWISNYYHYPAGQVLASALPPNPAPPKRKAYRAIKNPDTETANEWAKRGGKRALFWKLVNDDAAIYSVPKELSSAAKSLVESGHVESYWDYTPQSAIRPATNHQSTLHLSTDQATALNQIYSSIEKKESATFLLEGVTGSGKTEVYIHAALRARREGRSVLILAPEIALTPMLFARFQNRFNEPIALLHSGLTDRERSNYWHQIAQGSVSIVIGARSSILAPIDNVGLIVVDEEHESAFKQDDRLRYNARDLATVLGKRHRSTVILGSATPSLESLHNVQIKKYSLLQLKNRITGHTLPEVKIVDQRRHPMHGNISSVLRHEITEALKKKQQVMLLLNRRGFASYLVCASCGCIPECPNCSVSLTYYKSREQLKCHYCGFQKPRPTACEKCSSAEVLPGISGTESLEKNVCELFPNARILRIDRDQITGRHDLEDALIKISRGEVDIVVGTQMIAKGHDFPNVTLVGVIDADSAIALPDFRATERAFQLFTQMAGRAGRGDWAGKVIIQTYNPDHPAIKYAASHDFRGFSEEELPHRLSFFYPPYCRMARILVTAQSDKMAESSAARIFEFVKKLNLAEIKILGPAPSVIAKVQNKFRWNILLKSKSLEQLHQALSAVTGVKKQLIPSTSTLQIDVDPSTLM